MSLEYDALTALKAGIVALFDASPLPALTTGQVVIGYPDADRMAYSVMVYITPEGVAWERLTTESLEETMTIRLYLLVQMASTRTSMDACIQSLYEHFAAISNAINTDPTMGAAFDEAEILSADFYPAIEGMTRTVGLDISMQIQFERVPLVLPGSGVVPGEDVHPVGG